jgi:hypothetical protein
MTPEDIRAVRSIWGKVLPIKDTAAQRFCEKPFERDPSLKNLSTTPVRNTLPARRPNRGDAG